MLQVKLVRTLRQQLISIRYLKNYLQAKIFYLIEALDSFRKLIKLKFVATDTRNFLFINFHIVLNKLYLKLDFLELNENYNNDNLFESKYYTYVLYWVIYHVFQYTDLA